MRRNMCLSKVQGYIYKQYHNLIQLNSCIFYKSKTFFQYTYLNPSPHATRSFVSLPGTAFSTWIRNSEFTVVRYWPVHKPMYPKCTHFLSKVIGLLSLSSTKIGTCKEPATRAFSLSQYGLTSRRIKPSEFIAEEASLGNIDLTMPDSMSCLALLGEDVVALITSNLGFLREVLKRVSDCVLCFRIEVLNTWFRWVAIFLCFSLPSVLLWWIWFHWFEITRKICCEYEIFLVFLLQAF